MKPTQRQRLSELRHLLARHGIRPRRGRGQNFLIELTLVEAILGEAELGPDDIVLEVGTGTGSLTAAMAEQAAAVVSVEVDAELFHLAGEVLADYRNVTLLNCDVLERKSRLAADVIEAVQVKLQEATGRRFKLVANLPYNVATPVVSNLIAGDLPWALMVVTIQYELAEKMVALPGSRAYGALSVWLQSQATARIVRKLPPEVFWPRPQVTSAVVRLSPRAASRETIADRAFFHDFLRRLFTQRRKRLRGVLVAMFRKQLKRAEVEAILEEQAFTGDVRAEELSPSRLVELANQLHRAVDSASSG